MLAALLVLALAQAPDVGVDTAPPAPDTAVAASPSRPASVAPDLAPDTARRRPRAVEVSDGYALRLRVHRYASYATIPLFAAQSIAGNQLYQSGGSTPGWAKSLHGAGATGLGALFGINTVTGVWNAWESRHVAEGRTRRLVHGGLMLASDAGFAYAGMKLGPEATRSLAKRQEHRRIALTSMGVALLGYGSMLFGGH